jgi:4-oxalocrotonate tautomerase
MPFINVVISRKPDAELAKKIADGVVDRTERVLRKPRQITAVAVTFVPPEQWIIGGRSLQEQGLASFWLDIKVTEGTNTKDEKASYLAEVFSFMQSVLGPVHEESYILIHDVHGDGYGYGGTTQDYRYIRSRRETSNAAVAR